MSALLPHPNETLFRPYANELMWKLVDKVDAALEFQGITPDEFWDRVEARPSRDWCVGNFRDLLLYFLDDPVPNEVLDYLLDDYNGQYAADDPRRLELALDAVYKVVRAYAQFIHIGPLTDEMISL